MHPEISIADYIYQLPPDRIAGFPLACRDESKLLLWKDHTISETIFRNISSLMPQNALVVFNDTRVIEARLIFQKSTGSEIEIFCLEPHEQYGDITSAMMQTGRVWWKCLIGGASKWKSGQILQKDISLNNYRLSLTAMLIEKRSDCFIVELRWSPPKISFAEMLHEAGLIPLPPYIKRKTETTDAERYQTVYASQNGSVAAPTAGLHFTNVIMDELAAKKIEQAYVTLHVGAGTFKPVKSETIAGHDMHAEWLEVSAATIESLIKNIDGHIVAVGTTTLRTLESLYWLGLKTKQAPAVQPSDLLIHQWDVYEMNDENVTTEDALRSLLRWMQDHRMEKLITTTQLLIVPGYPFKVIDALVTNFHQPASTLLLLVAALVGNDTWKKIYEYAMDHQFRFLSYGDATLLFRSKC